MFYARINKLKVFDNREGFLGLFDRAELRIVHPRLPAPPPAGESYAGRAMQCIRPLGCPPLGGVPDRAGVDLTMNYELRTKN
jgi:hypothetical protein